MICAHIHFLINWFTVLSYKDNHNDSVTVVFINVKPVYLHLNTHILVWSEPIVVKWLSVKELLH